MQPSRRLFTSLRWMVLLAVIGMFFCFWIWSRDDSSGLVVGFLLYGLMILGPIGMFFLFCFFLGLLVAPRDQPPR